MLASMLESARQRQAETKQRLTEKEEIRMKRKWLRYCGGLEAYVLFFPEEEAACLRALLEGVEDGKERVRIAQEFAQQHLPRCSFATVTFQDG
jgi:hypothetical protein